MAKENSITKDEFLKDVAETMGVSKKDAANWLATFEDKLVDVITAEKSVRLGLGTISGFTKETSARTARNPITGETIQVPAKKYKGYPKMKFSKAIVPEAEIK